MNRFAQRTISAFALFLSFFVLSSPAFAAAPDGAGPWADTVTSFVQGLEANGNPVPAVRSNPSAALGVAEGDTADGHFVSLGFGGVLSLGFDNGISGGSLVVESTNPGYPIEKAKVELSADGTTWFTAGTLSQSGTVNQPAGLPCAKFARITDVSNPNDFADKSADGYDVDGVKAIGNSCTPPVACSGNCGCSDITQTNNTTVTTIIGNNANTGKNKVKDNTGGNNSVTTGNASNTTTVNIGGSSNTASSQCCNGGNTAINISGNGKGSVNIAAINSGMKAPAPITPLKKLH